jgi:hypothetical protein
MSPQDKLPETKIKALRVAGQARLASNCHPDRSRDASYFYKARCAGQPRSQYLIIAHIKFISGGPTTGFTYSASLADTCVITGAALGTSAVAS